MMDLKTCPFCGSEVKVFDNHTDFNASEKRYGIMGPNCTARFGFANGYNSKHLTVRKYNKRTADNHTEARMKKRINALIDESIEDSINKYGTLALKELKIKIKYMDMDV